MSGKHKKEGPSAVELQLRRELDRARLEIRKLKDPKRRAAAEAATAAAAAAAAAVVPSPAADAPALAGDAPSTASAPVAPQVPLTALEAALAAGELPPGHAAVTPEAPASGTAPAAPVAPGSGEPAGAGTELVTLRAEMTNLTNTKQRLSRLYFAQVEENRRRTRRFHLLLEDLCGIGSAIGLDAMLARLAQTLRDHMGFRIVVVRVREPGTDRLRAHAFAGLDEETRDSFAAADVKLEYLMSQLGDEYRVSRSYFISHRGVDRPSADGASAEDTEWGPNDVLLVPIYGRAGDLLAYFSVEDPVDRLVPSLESVEMLEILANFAGAAIENALLYRQLEGHTRDLEASGSCLREVLSLKNDFISTVSRELRAPLAAIRAHLDNLRSAREDEVPFDLQRRFLGIIHDESERLARLIESVLELSRFDAGVLRLARHNVDVAEVLEEAADQLAPAAQTAQVDLKAQIDAADTRMDADRDQLKQLLLHLGGNAVKFTPPGGRVTLRLFGDSRDVTLEVEDSGSGIPEALLQRILGRSQPADSSLIGRFGGAGLGLAFCRSIVEWHGGHVFAESAPGQGSRFTVVLPRRTGPRVVLRPGADSQAGTGDVLRMAVEMVAQVMNARVVSLLMPAESGELVVQAALGLEERVVREAAIKPGSGVAGWVAENRRPICVSDPGAGSEDAGTGRDVYRTGTFLSVPLEGERGLLGVLNVTDPITGTPFRAEDCHLMLQLAERVSAALQQVEEAGEAGPGLQRTAQALRAPITDLEHGRESASRRVLLARATARALPLPESEVGLLSFAASLEGIAVAPPAPAAEGDEKAEEPNAAPISPFETMSATREIQLTRHEWWDGSGYPSGLEGTAIPPGGRILAVVDTFERMIAGSGRRAPLSHEEAIQELRRLAGARFDPDVVDAFERACVEVEKSRGEGAADSWEHASATQGGE